MQKMLDYSVHLAMNNERSWFHDHKSEYQEALAEFSGFVQLFLPRLHDLDPQISANHNPKDLMYRIARDVRFSKDKTPYNPAFRFHIGPAGKRPLPIGYFIQLQPENSFWGTGMHVPLPETTKAVRDYLVANPTGFQEIISDSIFADSFALEGEKLKNVPKGYDKKHPLAEYLKHKTWDIVDPIPDELLADSNRLLDYLMHRISLARPMVDYLNKAIEGVDFPACSR